MDIIKGNKIGDAGSIGVLDASGNVKGRRGGLFSPLIMTVKKNNPLATTIRGVPFDGGDAIAAYNRLIYLSEKYDIKMTEDSRGWLFESTSLKEVDGITREIMYLAKDNLMPVYTKSYEKEKLVQFVEWSSYIINARLPLDLFDVSFRAEKLNDLSIPNNTNLPLLLKE
jgi:hypothetical protein